MGKKRLSRQRKQHEMEFDGPSPAAAGSGGGGGQGDAGGWMTGPASGTEDFMGMDTGEAAPAAAAQQPSRSGPKEPAGKRGNRTTAQKKRKRKSLEKALAVASRVESKVSRGGARRESKKSLKKLWQKDAADKDAAK